jgi:hypothetical protein
MLVSAQDRFLIRISGILFLELPTTDPMDIQALIHSKVSVWQATAEVVV